jgi:regulator of sigma E protease
MITTLLLILGFGFVIFWHELGHFLAAKWVGIKCEQFAVGFGQAVFSWRKGIGFRLGNTQKEYRQRIEQHLLEKEKDDLHLKEKMNFSEAQTSAAAAELGLGDTEYRLNWIPLGGYVKMLGQDDLKPDAQADDPRAYNRKSVGARMLVISAGVIMNVILAAIGFIIVFLMGIKAQPAWVGNILPESPAQRAGLKVGDHIVSFEGKPQEDFTKIMLNVALSENGATVPMTVLRRVGDKLETVPLQIAPDTPEKGGKGFVALGFEAPIKLTAIKDATDEELQKAAADFPPEALIIKPGDAITAVNGQPVSEGDYVKLSEAEQDGGKPVVLTIRDAAGKVRTASYQPHFMPFFSGPFNLAGMEPRAAVYHLMDASTAKGKVEIGDVITRITTVTASGKDPLPDPSRPQLMERLSALGKSGQKFNLTVLHDGTETTIEGLVANAPVGSERGQKGLGVELISDEKYAVVSNTLPDSPAAKAGLQRGDTVTAVEGETVKTWYDVQRLLKRVVDGGGKSAHIAYVRAGETKDATLALDAAQAQIISGVRYSHVSLPFLEQYTFIRKANGPWQAVQWGVGETRDFILQFYLTIHRMIGGSVPTSNLMGPVGIFIGGSKIAAKGNDWLIWFLAMISANLAVVNFLPIPVVDGGQFMFLILEKIKGRPLSARAMAIAQYVGLAFLAGVVLFVTYHDIMRRY